jgi:glyoxylase-like metal-dependent hydrolase (beta-lactamase superfamily II)
MPPMEIVPGVHAVKLVAATGFLVTEQEMNLIDTGLTGSRGRFARSLRRLHRSPSDLRRILVTHGHPDHVGAVRELTRDNDAEVFLHPADLAGLQVSLRDAWHGRDRHTILAYLTRGPHAATALHDGDEFEVLGGLRVIHTPGHTPGHVCLYAPAHRLLFTGDLLEVVRGQLSFANRMWTMDMPAAQASVARLTELDVGTIAMSHYPLWRTDANAALVGLARKAIPTEAL